MATGKVMKVIGYIRVSTDEQARDGVSLDAQLEKVHAYAKLYDLELVEVITDAGISAKTLDRPGLTRALAMLDDGRAEGVVVVKLDRLTRSVADLARLLDAYFGESAGKQLFSVGDSIDTRTAAGRLVLNVLMSVSQWEREVIVERTRGAMAFKRSRGERVSGRIPFGSRLAGDGKTLEPEPGELAALDDIRAWHATGKPLRWIASELDRRGIPPKTGNGRWSHATVQKLVARPA